MTFQECIELLSAALVAANELAAEQQHREAGHCLQSAIIQAQDYPGEEVPAELADLFEQAALERDCQYQRQSALDAYLSC